MDPNITPLETTQTSDDMSYNPDLFGSLKQKMAEDDARSAAIANAWGRVNKPADSMPVTTSFEEPEQSVPSDDDDDSQVFGAPDSEPTPFIPVSDQTDRPSHSKIPSNLFKTTGSIRNFFKTTCRKLKPISNNWYGLVILLVIALAQLTLFWRPIAGIYFTGAALAVLIGLALWRKSIRQLAISAAIIPISLMVVLSLPQTTTVVQLVVFYSVILVLGLIYRLMLTLDFPVENTHLTKHDYGSMIPLMIVLGLVFGAIVYGLTRSYYVFDNTSLPLVAAILVAFALVEETLFRGLIQQRASQVMSPIVAIILSAGLFTLMSIDHTTAWIPISSLLLGLVLAYVYYKKQNLILTFTLNASTKLAYIALMAAFIFRK